MEGRLCFHIEHAANFNEHTKQMAEWEFDTSDVDVFGDSFQDELEWAHTPEWAYSDGTVLCESRTAGPERAASEAAAVAAAAALDAQLASACAKAQCNGIPDSDSPAVPGQGTGVSSRPTYKERPKIPSLVNRRTLKLWPCEAPCRLSRLDMTQENCKKPSRPPDDPTGPPAPAPPSNVRSKSVAKCAFLATEMPGCELHADPHCERFTR